MWTSDDFPGADRVPWQLLIRARFVHEIDAIVASRITRALAAVLPAKAVSEFGRVAARAAAASPREEAGPEVTVRALRAYDDFEEICPRWPWPWPGHGPWPHPHGPEEFVDPIVLVTIDGARELLAAGTPDFQKSVGAALDDLAGSFAR
ncbi:MAG: hypothetical protein DI534_03570 [Leifsonia xyli]|nr:MAG: hypothetical protein DI534_03570 [Leifsonia xyli]